ncbi:hypothetical protein pb186bvf_021111 [Paramecium bursaria]
MNHFSSILYQNFYLLIVEIFLYILNYASCTNIFRGLTINKTINNQVTITILDVEIMQIYIYKLQVNMKISYLILPNQQLFFYYPGILIINKQIINNEAFWILPQHGFDINSRIQSLIYNIQYCLVLTRFLDIIPIKNQLVNPVILVSLIQKSYHHISNQFNRQKFIQLNYCLKFSGIPVIQANEPLRRSNCQFMKYKLYYQQPNKVL